MLFTAAYPGQIKRSMRQLKSFLDFFKRKFGNFQSACIFIRPNSSIIQIFFCRFLGVIHWSINHMYNCGHGVEWFKALSSFWGRDISYMKNLLHKPYFKKMSTNGGGVGENPKNVSTSSVLWDIRGKGGKIGIYLGWCCWHFWKSPMNFYFIFNVTCGAWHKTNESRVF